MSLFKRNIKIRAQLKLVSLHIPKTAGTSFRNILREVYGEKHVVRFDISRFVTVENEEFTGSKLKADIQVIHGHFPYYKLIELVEIPEGVPVITWLRDPAERVISNYFYLEKILREELDEEKKDLNILAKMQKTLIEYANTEANRNRMSKFLKGIEPEELFFIGLMDHYAEDLQDLARLLGWKDYPVLKQNVTGEKPQVDKETLRMIKELNSNDYEIYNKALRLREERINKRS
jgi:hypothetical protein